MQCYLDLMAKILEKGEAHEDRTGVGTKSLFGETLKIDMRQGFPLLTTKKVPFRWVWEELMWFLSGSTSETDLRAKGVDIWKEWATEEQCAKFGRLKGDLGPVYGRLWRAFPVGGDGVDQIGNLLYGLFANPGSRRHIVSGWHPQLCEEVALPPCHTLWQVKCHGATEISLCLYARSIDCFLGLPFNIASYATMLEILALMTGRTARELTIQFGDVHLYSNSWEVAKQQLARTPGKLPRLVFDLDKPTSFEGARQLLFFDMVHDGWTEGYVKLEGYQHQGPLKCEVAV